MSVRLCGVCSVIVWQRVRVWTQHWSCPALTQRILQRVKGTVAYFNNSKARTVRGWEFAKRIRFELHYNLKHGSCVTRKTYGQSVVPADRGTDRSAAQGPPVPALLSGHCGRTDRFRGLYYVDNLLDHRPFGMDSRSVRAGVARLWRSGHPESPPGKGRAGPDQYDPGGGGQFCILQDAIHCGRGNWPVPQRAWLRFIS